jgi:hydroxymethylbilane synthase
MLPIALRTEGRRALIVGGGNVALRKAESLIDAGMRLHVVSPQVEHRLRALIERSGGLLAERTYVATDLAGIDLAVAATDDASVNERVVSDARIARVPVCDALDPERGDFSMQATVRIGDLTFSIDSGASSPAFARRIAREIADRFGPAYDAAARTIARMRSYVFTVAHRNERSHVMRSLSELPIESLARMNPAEAEHEAEAAILRLRGTAAAPTSTVVCASRESALAMAQARIVAARLAEHGIATTMLGITTAGDRFVDRPIAALGSENVWIKELEIALRERRADYAVHSCKDLPGVIPPDMRLAAFSQREDPRDAFCSERFTSFDALPSGAVVGTSSMRRRTQLEALRPDLRYENIRGNVDTRLRKLREGTYDAIVLAMAGLLRLRQRATYTVPFAENTVVPAVAQGALAVEVRADDERLAAQLRAAINDTVTERCVGAERAALRALRAGCDAPLGIHAKLDGRRMRIDGAYVLSDPLVLLRERVEAEIRTQEDAEALGERLAEQLAERIGATATK